jgi:hypothetical protein
MRLAHLLPPTLIAGFVAVALCIPAVAAEPPLSVTFAIAAPASADQPPVTAIGLRAAATAPTPAAEVVVLVDTSATQTGTHRQRTLDAVAGILASARPVDRFSLTAVDVTSVQLCDGFHTADSESVRAAVRKLDSRTPLGTTDIVAAIDDAMARFDGEGPKAVIYIGNGPGLGGVDPDEFARVVDMLRSSHVAVSVIGIGPQVNWQCLAALAANAGGMAMIPHQDDDVKTAAGKLGTQAVGSVTWPTEMALENHGGDGALRMLPTRFPPVRADRDSVVLLEGTLQDAKIELGLGAQKVTLSIPAAAPEINNAYLSELARNARPSDGLFLPIVGREGLSIAKGFIRGEAASLAALAAQAQASGAHGSAARLAEASLRRDPSNQEASVIREASMLQPGAEAGQLPEPLPAGRDDELLEIDRQRRVRGQVLAQDAAVRIRAARGLLTTDPDQARDELKALQLEIERSTDLEPAGRAKLLAEVEMRIREAIVRAREKTERDLANERRAAIGRERLRLTSDLQRREDKIRQLTEKYNALVEEGIRNGYAQAESYPAVIDGESVIGMEVPTRAFVEAERVAGEEIAREAPPLYANAPIPMTARLIGRTAPMVARMLAYDSQNFRTIRDQQRGFMDQLHLVDVAGIPFSDEPPIIYPSAQRWRDITKLREKYKSVDLANPGSKEKDIYDALEKPVQRWEFNESPLRDVQRAISDEFRIPVEIDTRALEDAGLDLDTPVTQNASGISLRAALRRLLNGIDLAYIVKDEVLLITTKEKADENLVVKVYPVADLVLPVDPGSGLNPFQTGGGLGGAGGINSGQNMGGGMGGAAGGMGGGGMGGMGGGGFCWVAREVYGVHDPRWMHFRAWLTTEAPEWLFNLYADHGEAFAAWLRPRPAAKGVVRVAMDLVLTGRHGLVAGSALQVTGARTRLADRSFTTVIPTAATIDPEPAAPASGSGGRRVGLPTDVLGAADLRSAVTAYLTPERGNETASEADAQAASKRLEQLRVSAAQLGEAKDFKRAADLISAAIACGHAEPWMYESLAIALEASGEPRSEVERALLSAADFATSPAELMQLAYYLARYGAESQAVKICRRITRADPTNREAFALAMTLGKKANDIDTLRWACPGVLAHDWPASQQEVATSAARLARATIDELRRKGSTDGADAFQKAVDAALVRDLVVDVAWTGDADVDIAVLEPTGGLCSTASSRSASGGVLFADGEAGGDGTTHRERYVVSEAFPGEYKVLVRRAWGNVAADKVTVEVTTHRGTKSEQILRRQIPLGADEHLLKVVVPEGRRREPLLDAQIAQDVSAQRTLGRSLLAQQLAAVTDPGVYESMGKSRSGGPSVPPMPGLPFVNPRGAVGYQPIVSTLPEGVNLYARAVVSADRRYVRITAVPLFSGVGNVTTFNFSSGDTQNVTGQSAGGGGFQGAGGVPQGAGGGGLGAGGAGGAGGAAGGGAGGMQAAGGGGGGIGICWVAREVYGETDPRWLVFRSWLLAEAPTWLREAYITHGEAFAAWIHDRPAIKSILRLAMDRAIADRLATADR